MRQSIRQNLAGFTLLETITSLSLFALVIILVANVYLITQRTYNKNSDMAELTQNARVSLDRISRELRQSAFIVSNLPPTAADPMNPPLEEIFFQDGHNQTQITYLRYYLNGSNLMRQHKAYYFAAEPNTYVIYSSVDQGGQPPSEIILEDRIVGEYFSELKFWGADGLINFAITLTKNQNTFSLNTAAFSRNQ